METFQTPNILPYSHDHNDKSFLWDDTKPQLPITHIPLKPSNPSKLTLCYFRNGQWFATLYVRYVNWPEAFPAPEKPADTLNPAQTTQPPAKP